LYLWARYTSGAMYRQLPVRPALQCSTVKEGQMWPVECRTRNESPCDSTERKVVVQGVVVVQGWRTSLPSMCLWVRYSYRAMCTPCARTTCGTAQCMAPPCAHAPPPPPCASTTCGTAQCMPRDC
jgi:hypothetical protein